MQCPRCQRDNRAERRFCAECGAALPLVCQRCEFLNLELPRFRGRVGTFGSCRWWPVLDLITQRRFVVERGVPTVRVVPPLDKVEDRDPRLGRGGEASTIEELALEGGEEALAEGIDAPIHVK